MAKDISGAKKPAICFVNSPLESVSVLSPAPFTLSSVDVSAGRETCAAAGAGAVFRLAKLSFRLSADLFEARYVQAELSTCPRVELANFVTALSGGFGLSDGRLLRREVAIGGAVGQDKRASQRTIALNQLAGFLIGARRVETNGGEDDESGLAQQLYELGRGLDRRQVERGRSAGDQHHVGDLHGGMRGAVRIRRCVDHDQVGPLRFRRLYPGGQARRRTVDYH